MNDGCFARLEDVPKYALTLTIPTLLSAGHMFCTVPGKTKTAAVTRTVEGPVTVQVPATGMRNHPHAVMFCDRDSGVGLL